MKDKKPFPTHIGNYNSLLAGDIEPDDLPLNTHSIIVQALTKADSEYQQLGIRNPLIQDNVGTLNSEELPKGETQEELWNEVGYLIMVVHGGNTEAFKDLSTIFSITRKQAKV